MSDDAEKVALVANLMNDAVPDGVSTRIVMAALAELLRISIRSCPFFEARRIACQAVVEMFSNWDD